MTELVLFFCPTCVAHVQATVVGSHYFHEEEYAPKSRRIFGRCVKCDGPVIMTATEVDNDVWHKEQLYPPLSRGLSISLPAKVKESYDEAFRCSSAHAWLATAVMVRRTLEAIGREFDPSTRRLVDALRAMKVQGVISEELSQWGDELRFLGNISAHPTDDVVTPQDAQEALEFLGAIVETIYHLRPKFQAMRERRRRASTKDEAQPNGGANESGGATDIE